MTTSERVLEVMECLDINPYVLEKECGIKNAQSKISHYKKGITKSISGDMIIQICEAYPHVNANYILTGKGSMFMDETEKNENETIESKAIDMLDDMVDNKQDKIEELKKQMKALKEENNRLTIENNLFRELFGTNGMKQKKSVS